MTSEVVRLDRVTRRLDAAVPVTLVDDVSLRILAGECVAIIGPSGSGKSSLLYILGLLDRPTSGQVFLQDVDTGRFDDRERARARLSAIGFVFQSHFLLPEFTACENVMLPMQRLGRHAPAAIRTRAFDLLSQLGMAAEADRSPKQLSGGQSQRVAIARALANDPALILADEPTGNLDSAASANVERILLALAHEQGRAVAIVTHDASLAARTDRLIRIVDGAIRP